MNAENIQATLDNNTLSGVYVAKTDIKRGETLMDKNMADEKNANDPSQARDEQTAGAIISSTAEANVYQSEIYTSLKKGAYITDDQLGGIAIVDIPAGTPIMANMIEPLTITQDTREFEISTVELMVDQQEHDVIDIRIAYPNGEEYTVLSKKEVQNLSLAYADFRTYMNEEEILRYRNAVVDAAQTTGALLYATRYVEPNLQDAATVNYLVRSETIDLMRTDPNIYSVSEQTLNASARMALEVRLGQLTEEQLAAVADKLHIVDTAKNSVLSQNVDNNSAQINSYMLDNTTSEDVQNSYSDVEEDENVDVNIMDDNDIIASPFDETVGNTSTSGDN